MYKIEYIGSWKSIPDILAAGRAFPKLLLQSMIVIFRS